MLRCVSPRLSLAGCAACCRKSSKVLNKDYKNTRTFRRRGTHFAFPSRILLLRLFAALLLSCVDARIVVLVIWMTSNPSELSPTLLLYLHLLG